MNTLRSISLTFILGVVVAAQSFADAPFAKVFSVQGQGEVRGGGSKSWIPVSADTALAAGDEVRTLEDGRLAIEFPNGPLVRIGPNSSLVVTAEQTGSLKATLAQGLLHVFSRSKSELATISTPVVTAAIRGTEFTVSTTATESLVQVLDGRVSCRNEFGAVDLGGGEEALTERGKAPVKRLLVDRPNAIQWTLFYPRLSVSVESVDPLDSVVGKMLDSGRSADALALLRTARSNSLGNRAKAKSIAQEATIALTRSDMTAVKELMREADKLDASVPELLLAHSYVSQAEGDLRSAREFLERAMTEHPASAMILARYAEILMGVGEYADALEIAKRAVSLDASNSYVLSVAGFAALTRKEEEEAEEFFTEARNLDSGSGLPYLGLGLLRIKRGELDAGIQLIERASHLEPGVSLYRSYLGKAYFEDLKGEKAELELQRAIDLDPEDPTPFLYRSYNRLDRNEPVKALWDLEDSFALNDNRAVFRSRLLLDQDVATRSAGLARAFKALGFNEIARIEAIKAINRDYTNYSAHLFLADSYSGLSGFAVPAIGEQLIGRTLSPVNFNSVYQDSSAPASYNEYSSLFDRPVQRYRVEAAGSTFDELYTAGALASGSTDSFGYSLSYAGRAVRGYRDGDTEYTNVMQWLSQTEITPDDIFFFDGNLSFIRRGDTSVGYDPSYNDEDFYQDIRDKQGRIAYHHTFGARSHFIAQVLGSEITIDTTSLNAERPLVFNFLQGGQVVQTELAELGVNQYGYLRTKGLRGDAQYIYSNDLLSVNFGGSLARAKRYLDERADIQTPPEFSQAIGSLSSDGDGYEGSQRLFGYSTVRFGSLADLTFGLNVTRIETGRNSPSSSGLAVPYVRGENTQSFISPKIGGTVYAASDLTLRAAYFESVSNGGFRELESLEPTLVSGFNQVFDDIFPATTTHTVAAGADYKLAKWTYIGSEIGERDLAREGPLTTSELDFNVDTNTFDLATREGQSVRIPTRSRFIRSYLYQVVTDSVVTGVEHTFTQLDLPLTDQGGTSHSIRAGANYFHDSGFFCGVFPSFYVQTLDGFDDDLSVDEEDGTENFWIVDALAGYQFSDRQGRITFGLANILDQDFRYTRGIFDDDRPFLPGFGAIAAVSYSF